MNLQERVQVFELLFDALQSTNSRLEKEAEVKTFLNVYPELKEGEWVQGFGYCRSIFSKQIRKQIDHNSVDGVEKSIVPIYAIRTIHKDYHNKTHIEFIKDNIAKDLANYLLKEGFINFSEDKQGEAITICGSFNIVDERREENEG